MCLLCAVAILADRKLAAEVANPINYNGALKADPGVPVNGCKMQPDSKIRRAEKVNLGNDQATAAQEPDRDPRFDLDQQIQRLSHDNAKMRQELARVTEMAMRFQEEARIAKGETEAAKAFALMLASDLKAKL